jgi:hypothetical protein
MKAIGGSDGVVPRRGNSVACRLERSGIVQRPAKNERSSVVQDALQHGSRQASAVHAE